MQNCILISGLRFSLHPNQTWIFALNDITIKVPKCTKYGIKACIIFIFLVSVQSFKFSFHYMCCQVRFRLQSIVPQNMAIFLNMSL